MKRKKNRQTKYAFLFFAKNENSTYRYVDNYEFNRLSISAELDLCKSKLDLVMHFLGIKVNTIYK